MQAQTTSFSILNRIELAETPERTTGDIFSLSFSILNRIELAETLLYIDDFDSGTIFQYPQSDRTRGNYLRFMRSLPELPFSILNRIELAETAIP